MKHLQKITAALLLFHSAALAGETIRIGIGTQDTAVYGAAGGAIVRELKLLEKFLPREGGYKDVTYDIQWRNAPSDEQLNGEVLAGRLDIVSTADFPAIAGHAAFLKQNSAVKTIFVAALSTGLRGEGNALLVPSDSPVRSIRDLKGRTISVPFGSSAHAFLLRAVAEQGWDLETDVAIISQTPEVGAMALKSHLIDAHADFAPFGELFAFRGFARKILDGESTAVPVTHGVLVRSDFAEKYPEIVVAYLKASLEADRLLTQNPERLSEQYEKWTGLEAEVFYAFHGPHGVQVRDYTFKPEVLAGLRTASRTLKLLQKNFPDVRVEDFVDDRYIRQAARELGLDYDARLKSYAPVPFASPGLIACEEIADPTDAGQIWVKGEAKVRLYKDISSTFAALDQLELEGRAVRVAFVHDRETGGKLFADKVWFAGHGRSLSAFLDQSSAEKWAKVHKGNLLTYAEARKSLGGERVAQAP